MTQNKLKSIYSNLLAWKSSGLAFLFVLISLSGLVVGSYRAYAATDTAPPPLNAVAAQYGINDVKGSAVTVHDGDFSLRWIDAADIEVTFVHTNPLVKVIAIPNNTSSNGVARLQDQRNSNENDSSTGNYSLPGWPCYFNLHTDGGINKPLTNVDIDIDFKSSSVSDCSNAGTLNNQKALNPELSVAYFKWVDQGRIEAAGNEYPGTFTIGGADAPNLFLRDSEANNGGCQDRLILSSDKTTVRWYELDSSYDGNPPSEALTNCHYNTATKSPPANTPILLANPIINGVLANSIPKGQGDSGTGSGIGTSTSEKITCEKSGFSLSWLLCPIVNGSLDAAQAIFHGFVEKYLITTPLSTDMSKENPVTTTWKAFRNIGNILLLFALLFVVFGQSIGGGIVDTYTAKKAIPRILIAAIGINLSIYLCAVLIDIFNVLGQGIVHLIVAPLGSTNQLSIKPTGAQSNSFLIIGGLLAAVAGGLLFAAFKNGGERDGSIGQGLLAVLPYILLFVVLPVLLAILGILITLLIRQAIILILVLVSPLAMAAFAIPGADKYAKKWLDAFIKALMVYPIITGIFGVSQVLAVVTFNAGGGSFSALIATLIIAFAPLFMIPFAFKLAGGVIGGLANTVKGGRDNLKKMWGDDKHNPYSLRTRMGHSAGHRVGNRLTFGAAGINSGAIRKIAGRTATNRKEFEQARASSNASKAAEAKYGLGGVDEKNVATTTAGSAISHGMKENEATAAAEVAANIANKHKNAASGEEAGKAYISTFQSSGGNVEQATAAADAVGAAVNAGVNNGGELRSISDAAAGLRKSGVSVSEDNIGGVNAAVRTAHRESLNKGHNARQQRAAIAAAAKAANGVLSTTTGPDAQAKAMTAARSASAAAAQASKVHYNGAAESANTDAAKLITQRRLQAEEAAGDAAAMATNISSSDAVHAAAGSAAAKVMYDTGNAVEAARIGDETARTT